MTGGKLNDSSRDSIPAVWLCDALPCGGDQATPRWLTGDETARLRRLAGRARQEFVLSRWLIRHALHSASGVCFTDCKPVSGRPIQSETPAGWHLSVSHSHGFTGCALSHRSGIGLDLEPIKRQTQWQRVVRRWFAPEEQDWLLNEADDEEFLTVWTLKEAWLKATGRGIANQLQSLRVHSGFVLTGDNASGWASVGRVSDHLVSVVSLHEGSQPQGQLIAPSDDSLGSAGHSISEVKWLLHRPIRQAATAVDRPKS